MAEKKDNMVFMQKPIKNEPSERDAAIAAGLTDESFADDIAKKIWGNLPEENKHGVLTDFYCSVCTLTDTYGLTIQDIEKMSAKEIEEMNRAAIEKQRAMEGSPAMLRSSLVQLENIQIAFNETHLPRGVGDKYALQIVGNCERCGSQITRSLMGENFSLINAFGGLLMDARKNRGPTGRNDPCPCGSGKKYKKCCGGNSKAE